jgi:4-hydroxybenzoate polyprenyltransferase
MLLQFIKAIRPINLLAITLTFYVLQKLDINSREFITGSYQISLISLKVLTISTLLIAAAGYLINNYYDKEIDIINKGNKLNTLSKEALLTGYSILNITALILSFTFALSNYIFCIFPCSIFLLWLYSFSLKGLPFIGNLSVALLSATVPIIYLSIQGLTHASASSVDLITTFSFLAFFSTLAREVVKDIEDIKGDKAQGLKTIPILWGIKTAKFYTIFFLLCTLFILGLLIAGIDYFNFTILSLVIASIFGVLPLLLSVAKSYQATEKKHYKQAGNYIKISMFGFLLFIYIHAITI